MLFRCYHHVCVFTPQNARIYYQYTASEYCGVNSASKEDRGVDHKEFAEKHVWFADSVGVGFKLTSIYYILVSKIAITVSELSSEFLGRT